MKALNLNKQALLKWGNRAKRILKPIGIVVICLGVLWELAGDYELTAYNVGSLVGTHITSARDNIRAAINEIPVFIRLAAGIGIFAYMTLAKDFNFGTRWIGVGGIGWLIANYALVTPTPVLLAIQPVAAGIWLIVMFSWITQAHDPKTDT